MPLHDEFRGHSMATLVGEEKSTATDGLDEENETSDERAKRELYAFLEGELRNQYGPLSDWIQILDDGQYAIAFRDPDVLVTGRTLPELYQEVQRFLASLPQ